MGALGAVLSESLHKIRGSLLYVFQFPYEWHTWRSNERAIHL